MLTVEVRTQELCASRGGRPELSVPDKPCGFRGRNATLNPAVGVGAREMCEQGGGPGLSFPIPLKKKKTQQQQKEVLDVHSNQKAY